MRTVQTASSSSPVSCSRRHTPRRRTVLPRRWTAPSHTDTRDRPFKRSKRISLLAGCTGVLSGSDDDRDPYAVEDHLDPQAGDGDENETLEYLAPGVTADGVENVSLLLEHHFDALERESGDGTYTYVEHSNVSVNETLVNEHDQRTVVDYPTAWRDTWTRTTSEDDVTDYVVYDLWVDETEYLQRAESTNDSTRYEGGNHSEQPGHPVELERQLALLLSFATQERTVSVDERTRDGETWYVLTRERDAETDASSVDTHTIHVREDGFVERVDEESFRETWRNESAVTEVRQSLVEFEVDANGTLERPDWYEEAREATAVAEE